MPYLPNPSSYVRPGYPPMYPPPSMTALNPAQQHPPTIDIIAPPTPPRPQMLSQVPPVPPLPHPPSLIPTQESLIPSLMSPPPSLIHSSASVFPPVSSLYSFYPPSDRMSMPHSQPPKFPVFSGQNVVEYPPPPYPTTSTVPLTAMAMAAAPMPMYSFPYPQFSVPPVTADMSMSAPPPASLLSSVSLSSLTAAELAFTSLSNSGLSALPPVSSISDFSTLTSVPNLAPSLTSSSLPTNYMSMARVSSSNAVLQSTDQQPLASHLTHHSADSMQLPVYRPHQPSLFSSHQGQSMTNLVPPHWTHGEPAKSHYGYSGNTDGGA